jgi:transcription initiation factor TFIIB
MSLLADDRRSCPECPGKTRLELDYSAGDLICTACGLVVMSQCFDDAQEWRNFAQEGVENGPRVDSRARSDSF